MDYWWYIITSKISYLMISQFTRAIPLLEGMIVSDGIMNSIKFVKEYMCYKIYEKSFTTKEQDIKYKEDLIMKYNTLYMLSILDRYILYSFAYLHYSVLNMFIVNKFMYITYLLLTFPKIQNAILNSRFINVYVNDYLRNKKIFIHYSFSKLVINFVQNLDNSINNIKNYQIFILYRYYSYIQV
jgi:hypothetical protein